MDREIISAPVIERIDSPGFNSQDYGSDSLVS